MVLYIDTTDFNAVIFAAVGERPIVKKYVIDPHHSHRTTEYFGKFLKASKIKPRDITKIIVCKGPGSYTGTRIGVVMAQALGFVWNVPVSYLSKDRFKIPVEHAPKKKTR